MLDDIQRRRPLAAFWNALTNKWTWISLLLAGVLALFIVNPVARLIVTSFLDAGDSSFTLDNYISAFSRQRYLTAFWTTLRLGVVVTVLCLVVALPLAWGVSRTNMPGKRLVYGLVLAAFLMPPYLGAIGWILLAGPNAGWLNKAYMFITGVDDGILNIYSFNGLAFIISFYSFPYLFIFVCSALDSVSSEMEDAANILGAGLFKTVFKVTLPLVLPAILAGCIITFLETISLVGTPMLIAMPAGLSTVTTQLTEFFNVPIRVEVAIAYSMPLLLITVLLYFVQMKILGKKGYVSLTGKGSARRTIDLGAWRWGLFLYGMLIVTLTFILPCLVLAQAAFAKGCGRGLHLDNITFANFHYLLFEHSAAMSSIVNSIVYATSAATVAVLIAVLVSYIESRRLVFFARFMGISIMIPFVIPGIVLAIAVYASFAAPPFSWYGSALILIVAFTIRFAPIGYASASASISSIHTEMEDAVRILGASRLAAIRHVVAPLMRRSLIGAWLLVFIPASRELSSAMFLYGPSTRPMSIMLLDLSEGGNIELLAALGFILLVITFGIVAIGFKIVGRDFLSKKV